jgi:hypothetical protein
LPVSEQPDATISATRTAGTTRALIVPDSPIAHEVASRT